NLQENTELIQYYLKLLRLRKEAALRDYQPTPWEQLTPEEQIILAAYHAHICEEEDLDTLLKIQRCREATAKKKAFYDAEYRAKMTASIAAETTVDNPTSAPTAPTADKTTTSQLVPNYKAHSRLQCELAAAKELLKDRVKNMQVTTIARKDTMPATPASTPAPSDTPPQSKEGPRPTEPNESAMEIDEINELSPSLLVPTRTRPITPKIKTLSKEEQIELRAREHKALQKLMENHEIEALVKGWNPWEAKNFHFPAPPKKQVMKFKKVESGKNRSLSSNQINFDDPARWKRTTNLLQIAANLYKNID
ncbi:hypothetical protein PTTG_10031, partial [Puccinia triticina 1-1 BBBD Race 1]